MFEGFKAALFGTQSPEDAAAQAEREKGMNEAGIPTAGLEQPILDPIDALAGGLQAIPRGLVAALGDIGFDVFLGLVQEANQNNDYLKSMYIGPKGIKALGLDVANDTFGQFSNLVDKLPRLEVDNPRLKRPLGQDDVWLDQNVDEVARQDDNLARLYNIYPELRKTKVMGNLEKGGAYDRGENRITIGTELSPYEQPETFLHEIQHAIQQFEGLPGGSSPDPEVWYDFIRQMQNAIIGVENELDDIVEAYGRDIPEELQGEVEKLLRMKDTAYETLSRVTSNTNVNYLKTAGEVEARDTAIRSRVPGPDLRNIQPGALSNHRYGKAAFPVDEIIVPPHRLALEGY